MLITLFVIAIFIVSGSCLGIYIYGSFLYSAMTGRLVDSKKFNDNVFKGGCVTMLLLFLVIMLMLVEFILHLIS